jgi:MYXO-CTERM domain-containing protein
MIGMAGRRLPAAGIVVAAIAAAVNIYQPAPYAAVFTPALRLSAAVVTQAQVPQFAVTAVKPAWQQLDPPSAGVSTTPVALVALLLVGIAPLLRRRVAVPVSRQPRRGRAPPSRCC